MFASCLLFTRQQLRAQLPDLKFEHIGAENGLPQSSVQGITKDKYGFMWFGTWDGLCRFDGYHFKVYRFDAHNPHSINANRIQNIVKDTNDTLWVLTQQEYELCRYDYEKDQFDRIATRGLAPAFVKEIGSSQHRKTVRYSYQEYDWSIEKYTSLVQTNRITGQKQYYPFNQSNPWSINDRNIADIYLDDQYNLWVGTFNGGISKANLKAKPFGYMYHDPMDAGSIADNVVTAVCTDNEGNLWIGTYDKGISIIGAGGTRHIAFNNVDNIGLSHDQIRSLYCDSRGTMWIGTRTGLLSTDSRATQFKGFYDINRYRHAVYDIMEDERHDIWVATGRQGVYKYVVARDTLLIFNPWKTTNSRNTRTIIQARSGLLWVGTDDAGITVLQPVDDTVKLVERFLYDAREGSNTISDNRIYCLFEDRAGRIWVGTGNGLDYYDTRTRKFTHALQHTELSAMLVSAITDDDQGNLWISHKNGITRLDFHTLATRTYAVQDGLQSREFSDGAVFKNTADHQLYFGSNAGVNYFNPDNITPDTIAPKTVFTELQVLNHSVEVNQKVNGRVLLTRPLHLTSELILNYQDKSFAIEFAALHFASPQNIQYAYKLEGFDKDWTITDASRRQATYANLKPGSYTFLVKSRNSDGIWNEAPATLQITVKPPFWATNFAWCVYALLAAGAIVLYHNYTTRYNRMQREVLVKTREQELYQEKLQFFTNISHEVKTPLTLILAPLEKLWELCTDQPVLREQIKTMKNNGERLLRMINQLLDFRRLETGNTVAELRMQDIAPFLNNIVGAFQPLAAEKQLKLECRFQQEACWAAFDTDKLEKAVSNLLFNAVKFTVPGGEIHVLLNRDADNYIVIGVENTGNGISEQEKTAIFEPFKQGKEAKGGTGLGLAYTRMLVELHQGHITVESVPLPGGLYATTFRIFLPGQPPALQLTASAESGSAGSRKSVILVVEDHPEVRTFLVQHFSTLYQVLAAADGRAGLTLAREHLPDLIISDIMMPEMDGWEFCRQIKTNTLTAHIPLILLTAMAPVENEIEGYETGADDYIVKPFHVQHLTARVRNLLASRQQVKEKYRREIALQPSPEAVASQEEVLLKALLAYVEERITDTELSVDAICQAVGVSRSQLYRRVKAATGLSVADVIKEIRLRRAQQLLQNQGVNISEVAYMVGFANPEHFSKCFKAEFGVTPSEYQKNNAGNDK